MDCTLCGEPATTETHLFVRQMNVRSSDATVCFDPVIGVVFLHE